MPLRRSLRPLPLPFWIATALVLLVFLSWTWAWYRGHHRQPVVFSSSAASSNSAAVGFTSPVQKVGDDSSAPTAAASGSKASSQDLVNQASSSKGSSDSAGGTSNKGQQPAELKVDVAGYVKDPGVYTLASGSRVTDAIEAAGGALPAGSVNLLNLAAKLVDGEKIYVPSSSEAKKLHQDYVTRLAASGFIDTGQASQAAGQAAPVRVNINTATAQALEKVPGIGPSLASAIVHYRSQHGPFHRLQDLTKVSGIGTKTLADIQSYLSVS